MISSSEITLEERVSVSNPALSATIQGIRIDPWTLYQYAGNIAVELVESMPESPQKVALGLELATLPEFTKIGGGIVLANLHTLGSDRDRFNVLRHLMGVPELERTAAHAAFGIMRTTQPSYHSLRFAMDLASRPEYNLDAGRLALHAIEHLGVDGYSIGYLRNLLKQTEHRHNAKKMLVDEGPSVLRYFPHVSELTHCEHQVRRTIIGRMKPNYRPSNVHHAILQPYSRIEGKELTRQLLMSTAR